MSEMILLHFVISVQEIPAICQLNVWTGRQEITGCSTRAGKHHLCTVEKRRVGSSVGLRMVDVKVSSGLDYMLFLLNRLTKTLCRMILNHTKVCFHKYVLCEFRHELV